MTDSISETLAAHARLLSENILRLERLEAVADHYGEQLPKVLNRLASLECRELAALDPPPKPRGLDVEVSTGNGFPPEVNAILRQMPAKARLAQIDARMAELKQELGTLRGERERIVGAR